MTDKKVFLVKREYTRKQYYNEIKAVEITPEELELLILHDLPSLQKHDYDLNWKHRRELRQTLLKKLEIL